MCHQQVLHFLGGDLFTTAVDLVLDPADHFQVAVLALPDQITGAVEAFCIEGVRVVFRALEVTANGVGPSGHEGTDLPGGQQIALAIDHPHLVIGAHGQALGQIGVFVVIVQARVIDQPLGHAEHLLQTTAKRLRHAAGDGFRQPGATDLQQPQRSQFIRMIRGGLQPHRQRRRHQRRDIDPMPRDQRKTAGRSGIGRQNDLAARDEHSQRAG